MRLPASYIHHVLAAAAALAAVACGHRELDRQTRELMPSAVETAAANAATDVASAARALYQAREWAPLWDADSAQAAAQVLGEAWTHGLDAGTYEGARLLEQWQGAQEIDGTASDRARARATSDVSMTMAMIAAGHDVAVGRIHPGTFDRTWAAYRQVPDLASELATTVADGDVSEWFDRVAPRHEGYAQLRSAYQRLHESSAAGDRETLERMALNLDRWRWLPDDLGASHVFVNIPAFQLQVVDSGRPVKQMRVIVGKPGPNRTPVFSDELESVVFNPYWNIPDSIVTEETAPKVQEEDDYLARHQMEVLRMSSSGAEPVDPDDVDWDNPDELEDLLVRQRPGEANALGQVKFLFPNPHAVYLHDTPTRALFDREVRAFSHGCVRVEAPQDLAEWLLRQSEKWAAPAIADTMAGDEETHVAVDPHVPVHLVYFTAAAGDDGQPVFFDDIYDADARQAEATKSR